MDFLKKFFSNIGSVQEDEKIPGAVREIMAQVADLPENEAEYWVSVAYLMARVAYADLAVSEDELESIHKILNEKTQFGDEKNRLIIDLIRKRNELHGGTENYLVARRFYEISTQEQRLDLLECLFHVSAADESISSAEEAKLKEVASELRISNHQFLETRSKFREFREVLKGMPSKS